MTQKILFLIVAFLLVSSYSATANDAETAGRLKGNWLGYWKMEDKIGRLSTTITDSQDNRLSGYTVWYGLAEKEIRLPFSKAEIKEGLLLIYHDQGISLEGHLSADGRSLKGRWRSAAGGGKLELKKKDR